MIIFLEIMCLIQQKYHCFSIMFSTFENMPKTEAKRKGAPTSAPRKKGGSRHPGRPHKRLAADVLSARTSVLTKKLQVLMAKRTLLAERLEAYEAENKLRQSEEAEKQKV
jgi:hypothetical protein